MTNSLESAADVALTEEFFRSIRPDRIAPALVEIERLQSKRRDLAYRVLHSSHKMYHIRDVAFLALEAMFGVLGAEAEDDRALLEQLRRWGVDDAVVRFVAELGQTAFSQDRNGPGSWHEDARVLMAGFAMAVEVAAASAEAVRRIIAREGFLWHAGPLDPTDALFLEAWVPLGRVLRYDPRGADKARWRAMVVGEHMTIADDGVPTNDHPEDEQSDREG
jgi:hypothetical protein